MFQLIKKEKQVVDFDRVWLPQCWNVHKSYINSWGRVRFLPHKTHPITVVLTSYKIKSLSLSHSTVIHSLLSLSQRSNWSSSQLQKMSSQIFRSASRAARSVLNASKTARSFSGNLFFIFFLVFLF